MQVEAIRTRVFKEGEDVFSFVVEHLPALSENSVLVVTSKIVALGEGRTAPLDIPGGKEALIQAESDVAISTRYAWLTIKDGTVMASAGIDESNAADKYILLPKDSYLAADTLRTQLKERYGLQNLGVLITDSRTAPLKAGITGMSLGYAGFSGIRDYRGTDDIFGRKLKVSRTNVADSLAAAAVLLMGEGNEQRPLAIIQDAPIDFVETIAKGEIAISIEDDLYRPLFDHFSDSKKED